MASGSSHDRSLADAVEGVVDVLLQVGKIATRALEGLPDRDLDAVQELAIATGQFSCGFFELGEIGLHSLFVFRGADLVVAECSGNGFKEGGFRIRGLLDGGAQGQGLGAVNRYSEGLRVEWSVDRHLYHRLGVCTPSL